MPLAAAATALALPDPALVAALVPSDLAVSAGRVSRKAAGLGMPADLSAAVEALQALLEQRPFDAPEAARLVELGLGRRELAAAARAGALLVLSGGVVLLPDAPVHARELLRSLPEKFTVSQAKQAWHTSRRVAVPLLELLDRAGVTERLADGTRRLTDGT
jgi:selenocysteine-specific elongation factor